MLAKFNFFQKSSRSEAGVAFVTVIVVTAALITGSYYMFGKLSTTTKLVNKFEKKAISAYTMRGLVSYAKDLMASRVCIDPSEQTGIPTTNCKLTDSGSLERLLLTPSVFLDLCTYYSNNGKPQDGLQNFCEPGKPSLLLSSFEFNILASKINLQHALYPLFDKNYDSALSAKCLNFKYTSSASNTASAVATVRTNVTAYKEESCTGEVISEGGSVDIFYPRALNSYSLISNRSLSIGTAAAESDHNTLNPASKIIFQSPVYVNKNFYLPGSGPAAEKNTIFNGRVYVSGDVRNLSNGYMTPVLVEGGDLWLARYPHFTGIRNGLIRTSGEPSLTRMFDPTMAPAFDGSLTAKCNDYNRRKEAAQYCNDLPKLVAKKLSPGKYAIGVSKLSEMQGSDVKITSTDGTPVSYPDNIIPTKSQLTLDYGPTKVYLTVQASGAEAHVDLVKLGAMELRNGRDCIESTFPERKVCIEDGVVISKTPTGSPEVATSTAPYGTVTNSAEFRQNDRSFERTTVSNCVSVGGSPVQMCEVRKETYNVATAVIPGPQLKFLTTPHLTAKGTIAPQVFNLEIKMDTYDSALFEIKNSMKVLNFTAHPNDICAARQFNYSFKIDLESTEILKDVTSMYNWVNTDGTPINLTSDESDYLRGDFCYFEICSSVAPPASSYASYDADWSKEAFNSFNYNPIDNVNNYVPNASRSGYDKIFNESDTTVTNRIVIDSSFANLFNTYGIVDRCVIKSSAVVVKGLFICRFLVIEDRTADLKMVGTFIVDKLKIGRTGSSTITWMSLFHPTARDLISNDADPKNGLKSVANCPTDPNNPFWGMLTEGNRCDPSSLIQKKSKPMTWTTFDPLCIKVPGTPTSLCKPESRAYNFDVVRIYEYFGN